MNSRILFVVSRAGYAIDQAGFEYKLPSRLAHLNRGDQISMSSADAPDGNETIGDVFIEAGKLVERERSQFESAGNGSNGWTPITGNPNYTTGKPDTGRLFPPRES
jgi:hypothetical protein